MLEIIKKHLDKNQYFNASFDKTQIYLHHTVSSTVESAFNWWNQTNERVGTAYIVDKDGSVYECFSPDKWAWHIGAGSTSQHNKQSIGIEIVNEGWLVKKNDDFYWFDGKYKYNGEVFIQDWRGQKYWADYAKPQVASVALLVEKLVNDFSIKPDVIIDHEYDKSRLDHQGILAHCHVRQDKTDVSIAFDLEIFEKLLYPVLSPERQREILKTGD